MYMFFGVHVLILFRLDSETILTMLFVPVLVDIQVYKSNCHYPHRWCNSTRALLASSVVERVFEPRSSETKDFEVGICCFSAKDAALMRKSKVWLARSQDNVSEWGDISIRPCCFIELALLKSN